MDDLKDLGLTQTDRIQAEEIANRFDTVSDRLGSLVDVVKEPGLLGRLTEVIPWLGHSLEFAGDALPPIKALAKSLEKATTITDPLDLGVIACTAAYCQACVEALAFLGRPHAAIAFSVGETAATVKSRLKKEVAQLDAGEPNLLADFSLAAAESHEFTKCADRAFETVCTYFGYDESEIRRLKTIVHRRFRENLKILIASGSKDKDRFRNFRELLKLNTDDGIVRALVYENAERQVHSFAEQPVLQVEPFALADVYLDPDCGIVRASAMKTGTTDPFDDSGARVALLDEVLDKIGDPEFHDVIVVQGPPGAGKSTFTLRLCAELLNEGLCPVRVRMRDLPVEKSLLEAIAIGLAVVAGTRLENADRIGGPELARLFNESVTFRNASVCPYVFILDAWDEISRYTREGEGFALRVDRLMSEVRQVFLGSRTPAIRVVLTGRPSDVVANSPLMRDETPIHTIRSLRKEQLPEYVRKLDRAIRRKRFSSDKILKLDLGDPKQYDEVWALYRLGDGTYLEVLGLPLLLHLAIRGMANRPELIRTVARNPTALYRYLLDQTSTSAAKWKHQPDQPQDSMLPFGDGFRHALHQVALAITTLGGESIAFTELGKRTTRNFLKEFKETRGNPFSRLVIGFFFKAGNPDAVEFLHKSFREYLFAEAVVEMLLEYGRTAPDELPERLNHWVDFEESDQRYRILRSRLAPVLAAQSMTREIEDHVVELIGWHIWHQMNLVDPPDRPLTAAQWRIVRDGLADMWDWWGEGVHLRGQPYRDERDFTQFKTPFVVELGQMALPQNRYEMEVDPIPLRTAGHDSNLGMALFALAVPIHWLVAFRQITFGEETEERPDRRYQVTTAMGKHYTVKRFAPSGKRPDYFLNYVRRIQAAGWRLSKAFPGERNLSGVYFGKTDLTGLDFRGSNFTEAKLVDAILVRADLTRTLLDFVDVSGVDFSGAIFNKTSMVGTNLDRSIYTQSQLDNALRDTPPERDV